VIFAASFALFAPQPTGWLSFAVVAAVVGLRLGGVFLPLVMIAALPIATVAIRKARAPACLMAEPLSPVGGCLGERNCERAAASLTKEHLARQSF